MTQVATPLKWTVNTDQKLNHLLPVEHFWKRYFYLKVWEKEGVVTSIRCFILLCGNSGWGWPGQKPARNKEFLPVLPHEWKGLRHLGLLPLSSQEIIRELNGKWNIQDKNQCPDSIPEWSRWSFWPLGYPVGPYIFIWQIIQY